MKIFVHLQVLAPSAPVRVYLERRLGFALSRLAQSIGSVRARLSQRLGSRGTNECHCLLEVHSTVGLLQVQDSHRDLNAAIDLAAERLRRTLLRMLERRGLADTGRWPSSGPQRGRTTGGIS